MSRGNRIAVDAGWSEQCGLFFWRPPDWLAVLRDSELRAVRADDRSGGLQPNTYPTFIVHKGAVRGDAPNDFFCAQYQRHHGLLTPAKAIPDACESQGTRVRSRSNC
jgi:hypothetical protein